MAVIRVSGDLGSGKTTLCERLAKNLGYENHYTGDIFRQFAKEKGLNIEEFYKRITNNPQIEREIDQRQANLMMARDNIVVQGRIAPFLACNPHFQKINVFIGVSSEEGARRQLMRPENKDRTLEEMIRLSEERVDEERRHYKMLYGIEDHLDKSKFDVVIDTTSLNADQAYRALLLSLVPVL